MQKQCQQGMKKGTSTFHVTKCADPGRSNSGCVCIWMRCPGPFQTTCNPVGSRPPDTHVEYTYTHKEKEREGEERDRQRARERERETERERPSVRFRSATGLATCQSKWSVEVRFPSSGTPAVPICAEPIRHHCPSPHASLSGPWMEEPILGYLSRYPFVRCQSAIATSLSGRRPVWGANPRVPQRYPFVRCQSAITALRPRGGK